jgi:hypothetical protein
VDNLRERKDWLGDNHKHRNPRTLKSLLLDSFKVFLEVSSFSKLVNVLKMLVEVLEAKVLPNSHGRTTPRNGRHHPNRANQINRTNLGMLTKATLPGLNQPTNSHSSCYRSHNSQVQH